MSAPADRVVPLLRRVIADADRRLDDELSDRQYLAEDLRNALVEVLVTLTDTVGPDTRSPNV